MEFRGFKILSIRLILFAFALILHLNLFAQSAGDYRSNTFLGDWSAPSSWQRHNGTTWVAAVSAPTSSDGVITILNTHQINLTAATTIDQVVVAAGGHLIVFNATTPTVFTLNNGAGTDLSVSGELVVGLNATLSGSGTIVNNAGGIFIVRNNGTLSAVTTNNGTMSVNNTANFVNTTVTNNSVFTLSNFTLNLNTTSFINNGIFNFDSLSDTFIASSGGGSFTNEATGTLYKVAILGIAWIDPAPGTVTFINRGLVKGFGQVRFRSTSINTGTISPGDNSIATLIVNPAFITSKTPTYNLDLNSFLSYDAIDITNTDFATVNITGGILNVTDNTNDALNTIYTIFTSAATINGTFSTVNLSPTLGLLTVNSNTITIRRIGAQYTWIGGNGSWATPGNWSPSRFSTAATDVLVFNTGGTLTITNVPSQTIAGLYVSNNTTLNLQAATPAPSKTLTVGSSLNSYLSVAAGSTLRSLDNSGVLLNISIGAGSRANIGGTVDMQNGTFNVGDNPLQLHTSATPLTRTSGQFTIGPGGIIEVGDAQHTSGPAITLPNNIFISPPTVSRLIVNRTNGIIFGNQSITVTQDATLTLGNVVTNSSGQLLFGTAAASPVETSASKIVGYAGMLARVVNTSALDFLGYSLTAGSTVGTVTITRKTGTEGINTFNTSTSIASTWMVTATSEPSPGRSVRMSWLSGFDNGVNTSLTFQDYRYDTGPSWTPVGSLAMLQSTGNPRTTTPAVTVKITGSWTVADQLNVLPVELGDFKARQSDNTIVLEWKTYSEKNSSHFEIQKLNQSGEDFFILGTVQSHGNSKQERHYTFTDVQPHSGENYYRLRLVDIDGTFDYSKVKSVSYSPEENMYLYPNPNASEDLHLSFPDYPGGVVTVTDSRQKEIIRMPVSGNTLTLNTTQYGFVSGLYIVTFSAAQKRFVKKLVIK